MSDIVERLRYTAQIRAQHRSDTDPIRLECAEAADTITALRAENASLAAWQCVYTDGKTGLVGDEHGNQFCAMAKRVEALRAEVERLRAGLERETIEAYFARQIEWSGSTFGPGKRTGGIIDHISKELKEVAADPDDLSEWVDLIILSMDGFWRHGGKAEDLLPRLLAKQAKNMARTWPDWRTMSQDKAIEHDRSQEDRSLLTQGEG